MLFSVVGMPAMLLFGTGAILLMMFFSALHGVYVAALYRYATEGEVVDGFDKALLSHAFIEKRS
jgi:hypothetical protein